MEHPVYTSQKIDCRYIFLYNLVVLVFQMILSFIYNQINQTIDLLTRLFTLSKRNQNVTGNFHRFFHRTRSLSRLLVIVIPKNLDDLLCRNRISNITQNVENVRIKVSRQAEINYFRAPNPIPNYLLAAHRISCRRFADVRQKLLGRFRGARARSANK